MSFFFATPDAGPGELADLSWSEDEGLGVVWEQAAEDFEREMAVLAEELEGMEFDCMVGEDGTLLWGDSAVAPQALWVQTAPRAGCPGCGNAGCSDCPGQDCGACQPGDCAEEEVGLFEELEVVEDEEIEVPEEFEELEFEELEAPSDLFLERLQAPPPGAVTRIPSVVRFDSQTIRTQPGNVRLVPSTSLRPLPAEAEPLAGEISELVEEMRSEVKSLREVLRALREEIRRGGFAQQL